MPAVTRWFLKAALVYFAIALLLGAILSTVSTTAALAHALRSVQLHLLTVGWITQMIFGVAHWMFPRHSRARPRGSERLAWAIFGFLNAGLLLRALAEPLHLLHAAAAWGAALTLAGLLQWLAAVGFAVNAWGRVR